MGAFADARRAYAAIKDDVAQIAAIRNAQKSLVVESLTSDSFGFELTSSTVAGQSMAGTTTITKKRRLDTLTLLVQMLDEDAAFSSTTTPTF